MNFSEIFIKKPIMTVLVMVSVLIFGVGAYFRLPVSDLPVVDYPVITITINYPGASAKTMASAVASPIENECTQIPGLENMISTNSEGQTKIILTFNLNRSVDLAAPDVQAAISRAMGNLPTDLPAPPTYQKTNPSDTPVIYLMLTSDTLTPGQLYDLGNKSVGQRISMIDGVSQVQIWGAKTAARIQVDPNKLASFKIGIDEVARALKTGTVLIPAGSLNGPVRAFSIEPQGQLFKAKDYDELIVAYHNNAPVRLKDIATCVDSIENDVVRVMYGRPQEKMQSGTVVIPVSRQAGTNTVLLSKRIKQLVEELKTELPGSVRLEVFHDKSDQIVDSINDVKTTIFIAIVLVVLVIFLFIGRLSDTIIPGVAIPLSIVATFAVMLMIGFSLDNLSLMGIILAVGFVVDDAIVVLENSVRLIETGQKPFEAAINSAKEITFTVISMTVSLAIIFVPLVFMGGVVGRIFREFAVTVVLTIVLSGIFSLTLTPMMCARMLKSQEAGKSKLEEFVNKFLGGIISKYGALLKWTLMRPWTTIAIWIICFAGTILFFVVLPQSFLPEGDSGAVLGEMVVPLGTSTEKMMGFQDQVNEILQNDPNIDRIITATGLSAGADQSMGPFFTVLKPQNKRLFMQKVVTGLRAKMSKLPLGFVYVQAIPALQISTGGASTATGSRYSYIITGPDQDAVYKAGQDLEKKMYTLPGIVDIQNSVKLTLPQLNVELLRDRGSTLGITANDIEYALSLAYAWGKVTTYKTDLDQYDVIVELDKEYQKIPENLHRIYLHPQGVDEAVPLYSVVRCWEGVGPQTVPHINQLNAATLSFNVRSDVPLGTATNAIEKAALEIMPERTTGNFEGEAQEFQESIASLGILILIAIFLKYVVLGILYESYVHPLTILTTLPVATFGGLATLFIFNSELSLYAYVGLFMLLGIVAKNGIMMVDFANENLRKGSNDFDAIYQACLVRFRPILMTGLAAIMGAMPIALGFGADGSSRKPLGLIVVGGMIFSQVVTLFVTPGLFLYMQKFQRRFLDRFELTRSDSARKAEEVLN